MKGACLLFRLCICWLLLLKVLLSLVGTDAKRNTLPSERHRSILANESYIVGNNRGGGIPPLSGHREARRKNWGSRAHSYGYLSRRGISKPCRNGSPRAGRKEEEQQKKEKNTLYAENYKINLTDKPIIEEVPRNVKGRINEWIPEFDEDNKLGFFPILLEEMSNEPSPLQVGFEDYMQFNGENVEDIFKNMTREVTLNGSKKKIFGMCFFNHKTGVLAPLAVYAEIKDVTKVGKNLAVKGVVRGRIIIDDIVSQEPCILGKISPIEDKKGLSDAEESLKMVDEIIRIHSQCTTMESQLMEQLDQSFASMNIKLRNDLKESIDAKLEKFQVDPSDPEQRQAFVQIASFAAFDFHLMIVDRYDALMLQNSEDRLRFVRDKIRQKQKQLAIIKNTPKEKLQEILEQVQTLKNQGAAGALGAPGTNYPSPPG
ncbi:hypothetical protein C922_00023 [Plasmodium inui San Antonio 1]|uniref:Lon N-terminal domain-containing protein n=1 Tax=Plasmodium inui San Antonio 1 TaxID=1237626 RepID=W7ABV0_9APIC|nr:hypothetical protein C922_00023 [Plasmodium inui San Antonio 1]EUD69160.1 hypothetical protein C922_00023 [Plasmodium inui San Antonio 1]